MIIMTVIGIDLGTTNSCVAALIQKRIEIITNSQGERVTPSWVSFNDKERLIGRPAKEQSFRNPDNTLYQIKRLIGRMFDEETVQRDMKYWNFKVINEGNKPKITVKYKHETKKFVPEQISAEILIYLKKCAEDKLQTPVKDAVIAVPAHFTHAQRQATIHAGKIAKLNVLQIINEPTAAAIAYGLQKETNVERKVLIFDLGGGTFDVTILKIKGRKYEVLAVGGDSHLGGEDINNVMFEHFSETFNRENNCNIMENTTSINRLLDECEKAKQRLSFRAETRVEVFALHKGIDLSVSLRRSKFEEWNSHYFKQAMNTVENTIKDAGLKKSQIDEVVLVGGSTRIPKIRDDLEKYFKKNLHKNINAEEAVAYGAAIQAAIVNKEKDIDEVLKIELCDVAPLSLGIESNVTNDMVTVVPRNDKIPNKFWHNFTTLHDNQTAVSFPVYEGERPKAKNNHHLGTFRLENISPQPRGTPNFSVCFDVSLSGTLRVTATDEATDNESFIEISDRRGILSKDDIKSMIEEAEMFAKDDDEHRKRCELINRLENRVYHVRKQANQSGNEMGRQIILDHCSQTMEWIDQNKDTASMEIVQGKKDVLEMLASKYKLK